MTQEYMILIAVASVIFLVLFKGVLFKSNKKDKNIESFENSAPTAKVADGFVGFEDVEFNSDIQDSISVPLSQDEIDLVLAKLKIKKKKSKSKKKEKPEKESKMRYSGGRKSFNTIRFLMLYTFNLIALYTVANPYITGLVSNGFDKLGSLGGSVVSVIVTIISLIISIPLSFIKSFADPLYEKYTVFAAEHLTNDFMHAGALVGAAVVLVLVNSFLIKRFIGKDSFSAKIGVLLNIAIIALTVAFLGSYALDLFNLPSILEYV